MTVLADKSLAATVVLGAGVALALNTAAPVAALPSNCTTKITSSTTGQSACLRGSGTFRVVITCVSGATSVVRTGAWKRPGVSAISVASCNSGFRILNAAVSLSE